MQISKTDLIQALTRVLPGVEKGNPSLEGTDTVIFSGHAVHTFNNSIAVTTKLPDAVEGITAAFKALPFFKLIKSLTGDTITITEMEKGYVVASEDSEAELPKLEATVEAYIETMQAMELEYKQLPDDFRDALVLCHMPNNKENLTRGVVVDANTMVSTDRQRFNLYPFESAIASFRLDLPIVAELVKLDGFKEMAISSAWVHFRMEDGGIVCVKRMDHTSFPMAPAKMSEMLNTLKARPAIFNGTLPAGLQSAISSASIFGEGQNTTSGVVALVSLDFKKDKIIVKGESGVGRLRKSVKLEETLDEDPNIAPVVVHGQFLSEASRKAMRFLLVSQKDGDAPFMVFESDRYTHVAVTVQL